VHIGQLATAKSRTSKRCFMNAYPANDRQRTAGCLLLRESFWALPPLKWCLDSDDVMSLNAPCLAEKADSLPFAVDAWREHCGTRNSKKGHPTNTPRMQCTRSCPSGLQSPTSMAAWFIKVLPCLAVFPSPQTVYSWLASKANALVHEEGVVS